MENESIKLDYSLKTAAERNELVNRILLEAPSSQLTDKYLEILGNYILDAALTKEDKKSHYITTDNRQVTIDKRETSYEELVSKFENGEDGVYNLINNDRNMYLTRKAEISETDIEDIPELTPLRNEIAALEEQAKAATGKNKYLLKKQVIEMRQQQYLLKEIFKPTMRKACGAHASGNRIEISDEVHFDEKGEPTSNAIVTLFKPEHICAILCNYEILQQQLAHKYSSDFHFLMRDFDKLMAEGLAPYPAYLTLAHAKINGCSNAEIQKILLEKHNLYHTPEYISCLWRNKIPKILAEKAKEDYLIWYYTEIEKGNWKRCSRCGEMKLAHSRFFSKNNTSKDGYYSICKACRNSKNKEKK